jgi:hypothetical protein
LVMITNILKNQIPSYVRWELKIGEHSSMST